MKKIYKILPISTLLPLIVFAQEAERFGGTKRLLEATGGIIKTLIPIIFALGLLVFFWGIVKYIWSSGNEKDEGKKIMIWGVIALFVMASIWGIVSFIGKNLGLDEIPEMTAPTIKL